MKWIVECPRTTSFTVQWAMRVWQVLLYSRVYEYDKVYCIVLWNKARCNGSIVLILGASFPSPQQYIICTPSISTSPPPIPRCTLAPSPSVPPRHPLPRLPVSASASPPPAPSPSVSASSCRSRRRVPSVCNSAAPLRAATCCQCQSPEIINIYPWTYQTWFNCVTSKFHYTGKAPL